MSKMCNYWSGKTKECLHLIENHACIK